MVPWYRGGHADPWNHVEATMALAAGGRWGEVERAFDWLAANQLADGSWCTFYLADGVDRAAPGPQRLRLPCHRRPVVLAAGRRRRRCWRNCGRCSSGRISWCLRYQRQGEKLPGPLAPTAPSALSLCSLRPRRSNTPCARRPGSPSSSATSVEAEIWSAAAGRAAEAVAGRPGSFEPKDRWAMDWYYPVLSGAVVGRRSPAAHARALERAGRGRARAFAASPTRPGSRQPRRRNAPWLRQGPGFRAEAEELLAWTAHLRASDGSYWTGCVHPECVRYPGGQKSTYSAAAVLIADHVLNLAQRRRRRSSRRTASGSRLAERLDRRQDFCSRSPARADARRDADPAIAGARQGDHRGFAGEGGPEGGYSFEVADFVLGERGGPAAHPPPAG